MRELEVERWVLCNQVSEDDSLEDSQFEIRRLTSEEQKQADETPSLPGELRRLPGTKRVPLGSDPERLWDCGVHRWIIDSTLLP